MTNEKIFIVKAKDEHKLKIWNLDGWEGIDVEEIAKEVEEKIRRNVLIETYKQTPLKFTNKVYGKGIEKLIVNYINSTILETLKQLKKLSDLQ